MSKVYHSIQLPLFPSKVCSKCTKEKPLECFNVDRSKSDGLYPRCMECRKQDRDARTEEAKQRDIARLEAWDKAHPERRQERRASEKYQAQRRAHRSTEAYRAKRYARYHERNDGRVAERRAQRVIARQKALLVEQKFCPSCETEKPRDAFYKARNRRDGLAPYCSKCLKEGKSFAKRHPERYREYQRARKLNPDVRNHDRQVMRDWQHRNAEKLREQARLKYATDAEHAQKMRSSTRTWMKRNPLKRREEIRRYHARKKYATIGDVSYERVLERDGRFCYVCEQDILPHHKLEFDHVIPLFRGGSHSEDNVKVVHALCNRRKADKLIEELTPFQRRGPIT